MAKKSNRIPPEMLLVNLSPELRELAEALRELIRQLVPEVEEAGYPSWKLIGYRHGRYFAFIAPMSDHIRLGFEHGAILPDPMGILEGEGKQVRTIALYRSNDLEQTHDLIEIAAARAKIK